MKGEERRGFQRSPERPKSSKLGEKKNHSAQKYGVPAA